LNVVFENGDLRRSAINMGIAMVMTIGVGVLIGAALGLRFNVFSLIPAIILAGVSTAVIQVASGAQKGFVVLAVVLVATALQVSYLFTNIARALVEGLISVQSRALGIQGHMEVVGSDGRHVGTVDHTEASELVLSGDDPKAGGKPHLISVDWVDYVDSKVHLNKPSKKAVSEWQIAA
jgi:hypothetical protein